ncbi:MAG: putative toxin-antitoxin system toxin component, PIN family [Solirubrobacteraceae bacterium]
MRAVLDVNVHVSALLSRGGAPATILRRWLEGRFELLVSPLLLDELARTLDYPKLRKRIDANQATAYVQVLASSATSCADAAVDLRFRSEDAADDYLIAIAASERALLVSGDAHLLTLEAQLVPVYTPRVFLDLLEANAP